MGAIVFWITGVSIVYSIYCSGADQSKHQSSALLAFVRGFHRWPVNSPHKGPVTRKRFPFDDVIMHTPRELCMQFAPWCVLLLFGTRQLYVYPSVLLHWYKGHYSIPHSWLLGPDEQESPESIRNNDMASTKQTIIKQQYAFMLWNISYNYDVMKWKHFQRYWPFVREFTGPRWIPRTKASDAGVWCFLWSACE